MEVARSRAAVAAASLIALALTLAACGGSSSGGGGTAEGPAARSAPVSGGMMDDGGMMGSGSPAASPPTTSTPAPSNGGSGTSGPALFLSNGCGSCHTLAAAGTSSRAGPNLDQARPSADRVVEQVTNGGGGGMPAFAGSLTAAQIRAIADYVAGAAR